MGIKIFEKNKIDLDQTGITITASDLTVGADAGQSFVTYLRNRKNDSGWGTGGSTDAGNTTLIVESSDEMSISDILLVGHNFKAYSIQYWNGSAYVNFSTSISVSNNTATTTYHTFTEVQTLRVRIVITGTMTADEDKLLSQLILTRQLGEFTTEPYIKKPKQEKGRKVRKMLSGRSNVTRTIGSFSVTLDFPPMKDATDFALLLRMFESYEGFLVWLSGGSTANFFSANIPGFRLSDIYLCTCANDLDTEFNGGFFAHGQKVEVQLVESRI